MTLLDHFPWAKHKPSEEPTTPQERGRPLVSSGRGGAGNIRVASKQAENDTPPPQFRIANAHVGRGGVGNVRSPSRDPLERAKLDQEEQHNMQVEDQLQEEQLRNRVHLLGRGGSGNLPRNISPADEQRGLAKHAPLHVALALEGTERGGW
ncbi:hypothetical protein MVES_003254 [Malassezia vespertilionis]|uniref:Uncharacterized protein n=1 Tax=Malassezia vespertilionis TaxID=2020962 RepID=A0A2N1J8Q5_9BASI|nr:hypothetical protein MVES_003254 [Malassezia vespertilionis]